MGNKAKGKPKIIIERVQTGVRMEKRLLKVLKAMAEHYEISLGDLLESISCMRLTESARSTENPYG